MPARASDSRSPARRALGDLELVGELGGRDPAPGLEDQEGGDEAVGSHTRSLARKPATNWPVFGYRSGPAVTLAEIGHGRAGGRHEHRVR